MNKDPNEFWLSDYMKIINWHNVKWEQDFQKNIIELREKGKVQDVREYGQG